MNTDRPDAVSGEPEMNATSRTNKIQKATKMTMKTGEPVRGWNKGGEYARQWESVVLGTYRHWNPFFVRSIKKKVIRAYSTTDVSTYN